MSILAIIPARVGSKGIPQKNFASLAGMSPLNRAYVVAREVGCDPIVITTDADVAKFDRGRSDTIWLSAPAPLHTDECPMIDVVKDVLNRVPGPEDQIVVLLQPTQPLRTPEHVQSAIALLSESRATSVVSVVEVTSPEKLFTMTSEGYLWPYLSWIEDEMTGRKIPNHWDLRERRQDCEPAFERDGSVYAFWRRTVTTCDNIYGARCRSLAIDPSESCRLDTLSDWAEAERRLALTHR